MPDNFLTIEKNLLRFQAGSYYRFDAMLRNTDDNSAFFSANTSNSRKNVLLHSWWVCDLDSYTSRKPEMKAFCDLTGARLYVHLDRKSFRRTLVNINKISYELMLNSYVNGHNDPELSAIYKIRDSASSQKDASDKDCRMWMFDVDSDDYVLLAHIQNLCYPHDFFTLRTVKGYHVCAMKNGFINPNKTIAERAECSYLWSHASEWSIHENAMGLVYC